MDTQPVHVCHTGWQPQVSSGGKKGQWEVLTGGGRDPKPLWVGQKVQSPFVYDVMT